MVRLWPTTIAGSIFPSIYLRFVRSHTVFLEALVKILNFSDTELASQRLEVPSYL